MSARFDCTNPAEREAGLAEAVSALRKGELAVLPTDTVYGVAADAFSPAAVGALLAAKGRGRQAPPPVLVGTVRAAMALVEDLSPAGKDLIDAFWPGGLTIVCRANRSLAWDLGETKGTVALRMPLHQVTLEVLKETGPLAVSSANLTGAPPATTAGDAQEQLGDAIAVYLDGGPCPGDQASTIVDVMGPFPRLLRRGVIPVERLREVVALALDEEEIAASETPMAGQTAPPEDTEPAADAETAAEPAETEAAADVESAGAGPAAEPGEAEPGAGAGPEAGLEPEAGVGPEASVEPELGTGDAGTDPAADPASGAVGDAGATGPAGAASEPSAAGASSSDAGGEAGSDGGPESRSGADGEADTSGHDGPSGAGAGTA